MNKNDTVLDLSLRLLVAQHGQARVLEALSAIQEVDLDAIRSEIEACGNKTRGGKTQRLPRKRIEDEIRKAQPDSHEAQAVIRKLAHAYENKEFLPELRDVRRFMEAHSTVPIKSVSSKLRSRADGLIAVIGVLARCSLDELHLLDRQTRAKGSDLGIITEQILGRGTGHGKSA